MSENTCKSVGCKNESINRAEIYCEFHFQHPQTINFWFCETCGVGGKDLKKYSNYGESITLCSECGSAFKEYMKYN